MTHYEVITTGIGLITTLLVPTLIILIRILIRWVRAEDKLVKVAEQLDKHITEDGDMRTAIYEQMRYDREATNQRLTYLEHGRMERK